MTTICLKSKSSIRTETWSNVFSSFSTEAKSCVFMKQLTHTCISTILYLRKILSDDFFEAKSFEGMTLYLLNLKVDNRNVLKIQQWLEGAFDAIEKKYLKRLMLDIQDAESNKILEVYSMTFNYNIKKDSTPLFLTTSSNMDSGFSVSDTKLSTIKLLQMCYAVTQTYGNLPSKLGLSMRLFYYEHTPDDYEPSGYIAWDQPNPEFSKQARNIEMGLTGTQYHLFKLFNKSCLSEKFFKDMAEQLENSNSPPISGGDDLAAENPNAQIGHTKAKRELHFHDANKNAATKAHDSSKAEAEPVFLVPEKSGPPAPKCHTKRTKLLKDFENLKVRCSCLFSKKSESMFSCSGCGFLVHAECFGIPEFDPSKKIRFYCHLCHEKGNDYKCHDKVIVSLKNSSDQQKLSILRRVLGHCNLPQVKKITLNKMEKLVGAESQQNVIDVVLKKMIEIGVAIPQKNRKSYIINKNELTKQLVKYFYKVRNSGQKQQVLQHPLKSPETLQRIKVTEELFKCDSKKKLPAALQENNAHRNQAVSQQSLDIFAD